MNIPPPTAGNPYAAAAALDRQLRSSGSDPGDASSDSAMPDAGPDVVVTLSRGASSSPATYDASGRLARAPTLDDMGANGPASLVHATESHAEDDASGTEDAEVDQEAAVPA